MSNASGKRGHIFSRFPEVAPTVSFTRMYNQLGVSRVDLFGLRHEELGMLGQNDLIGTTENDQPGRQLICDGTNRRDLPTEDRAALGSQCLRTKFDLQKSQRSLSDFADLRTAIVQEIRRRIEAHDRVKDAAITLNRIWRIRFSGTAACDNGQRELTARA